MPGYALSLMALERDALHRTPRRTLSRMSITAPHSSGKNKVLKRRVIKALHACARDEGANESSRKHFGVLKRLSLARHGLSFTICPNPKCELHSFQRPSTTCLPSADVNQFYRFSPTFRALDTCPSGRASVNTSAN